MENNKDFEIKSGVLEKYHGAGGDVVIPEGVTAIGEYAFSDCTSLKSVRFPNGVRSIGECAFLSCAKLERVILSEEIKTIGQSAFQSCSCLHEIHLPHGLRSIGTQAFYGCVELESLTVPKSVRVIGKRAFGMCTSVRTFEAEEGNPFYHSAGNCLIDTEKKELIAGFGSSVIPNDGSVTKIADVAFRDCQSLRSIVIPESVESIGNAAFSFCENLTEVSFSEGLKTIGKGAFSCCRSLRSIVIPDSVDEIGKDGFAAGGALRHLSLRNFKNSINCVFSFRMHLHTCVFFPLLEDEAEALNFLNAIGLRNLVLPFLLDSLETNAFVLEKLKLYTKPKKFRVEYIPELIKENEAEAVAKLLSFVKKMSADEIDGYIEKAENTPEIRSMLLEYKNRLYSTDYLEKKEEIEMEKEFGLREKTLADYRKDFSIFKDGDVYKISRCKKRQQEIVVIPGFIKGVPVAVSFLSFCGDNTLREVYLEDGVTEIGDSAFCDCVNLENIHIPDSVKMIGNEAFRGCRRLADENGMVIIRDVLFEYCGQSADVSIPEGIGLVDKYAFGYCANLENLKIPASVRKIEEDVFFFCKNLKNIEISPENPYYHVKGNCLIDTTEKVLLKACLNSVIPTDIGIKEIGYGAFSGYQELRNIIIPDGVMKIGKYAFHYCEKLREMTLPDGVTEIDNSAFFCCENLQSITIPESVRTIGAEAFYGCNNLKIFGKKGSFAETYAIEKRIEFQEI